MDPFKLWLKNRHELNLLDDNQFKDIESKILHYFGGLRNILRLLLRKENNLNYIQLQDLLNIFSDYKLKNQNQNPSTEYNLLSISDNSLFKVASFLDETDNYHLQCVNSLFLNNSVFALVINEKDYKFDKQILPLCITKIKSSIECNEIVSNINKLIQQKDSMDKSVSFNYYNTGLLPILKSYFIKDTTTTKLQLKSFQLFVILLNKNGLYKYFDDILFRWINTMLCAPQFNSLILLILHCINQLIGMYPQYIHHIIKHKIHQTILTNVLTWNDHIWNITLLNLAFNIILKCFKIDVSIDNKDLLTKTVVSAVLKLNRFIKTDWKMCVAPGYEINIDKIPSKNASDVFRTRCRVLRVVDDIADLLIPDDDNSNFQRISSDFDQKQIENDTHNNIWLETITYNNSTTFQIALNSPKLELIITPEMDKYFWNLLNILLVIKEEYNNNIDIRFNQLKIGAAVSELLSRLFDVSCNAKLILILLKCDFKFGTQYYISNIDRSYTQNHWQSILEIVNNKTSNNELLNYLLNNDSFLNRINPNSHCSVTIHKQILTADKSIEVYVLLLKYYLDNRLYQTDYTTAQVILKGALFAFNQFTHDINKRALRIFINDYDGYIIVGDTLHILVNEYTFTDISNRKYIITMISYCIATLSSILIYIHKDKNGSKYYEEIQKKCIKIIMDLLINDHTNLLMNLIKHNTSLKVKTILQYLLSIPNTQIIDAVLLYLIKSNTLWQYKNNMIMLNRTKFNIHTHMHAQQQTKWKQTVDSESEFTLDYAEIRLKDENYVHIMNDDVNCIYAVIDNDKFDLFPSVEPNYNPLRLKLNDYDTGNVSINYSTNLTGFVWNSVTNYSISNTNYTNNNNNNSNMNAFHNIDDNKLNVLDDDSINTLNNIIEASKEKYNRSWLDYNYHKRFLNRVFDDHTISYLIPMEILLNVCIFASHNIKMHKYFFEIQSILKLAINTVDNNNIKDPLQICKNMECIKLFIEQFDLIKNNIKKKLIKIYYTLSIDMCMEKNNDTIVIIKEILHKHFNYDMSVRSNSMHSAPNEVSLICGLSKSTNK